MTHLRLAVMWQPCSIFLIHSVLLVVARPSLPTHQVFEPDSSDCLSALQRDSSLIARPLRAQRAQAVDHQASGGAKAAKGFLQEATNTSIVVEDFHDYRNDALEFVQERPELGCDLPRVSLAEAESVWKDLIQEFMQSDGTSMIEESPWRGDRPPGSRPTPLEKARYFLAMRLFGGPGIIEGVTGSWPAMSRWQESTLTSRLAGRHFRLTHFSYPDYVHTIQDKDYSTGITLGEYLNGEQSGRGFFLFVNEPEEPEKGIRTTDEELNTMDLVREDFMPHPVFAATPEERHAILALDGLGSSHGMHIHGPVWQSQVIGRKAWWLLPAEVPGDKQSTTGHSTEFVGEGSVLRNERGAAPVVDGKVYKEPNACAFLKRTAPPPGTRMCVAGPGDTVLLPDDMWHGTCALDRHTVSVGGWMVDRRWIRGR